MWFRVSRVSGFVEEVVSSAGSMGIWRAVLQASRLRRQSCNHLKRFRVKGMGLRAYCLRFRV